MLNEKQLFDLSIQTAELAVKAGVLLKEMRESITVDEIQLKGQGDFVSRADRTSEELLTEGLEKLLLGSVVMAEEESPNASGGEYRWIVDPLDGTTNYLSGFPIYAVSIGLEDRSVLDEGWGEVVMGVVHLPALGITYRASRNRGAYKNGTKFVMRTPKELSRSVLATGFPFHTYNYMDRYLAVFKEIFPKIANIRRMGAAAADLAWVAEGSFNGFWEFGLHPWDMAAGICLIKEAGGMVSDFWGGNPLGKGWMVTGYKEAYTELLELVQKHFPRELYKDWAKNKNK